MSPCRLDRSQAIVMLPGRHSTKGEVMARLLLLASLAISAAGCFTLGKQGEGLDKDPADSAGKAGDEVLELRDGGPKNSDERPKTSDSLPGSAMAADSKKPSERSNPEQQIRLRIMLAEVERPVARALGFAVGSTKRDDSAKLPWVLDDGALQVAMKPVLEKLHGARVLAEDTLAVQNGQAVTCLLRGAWDPVKYVGVALEGVSSFPFGVYLELTPTMTGGNWIRLELHAHIAIRDIAIAGDAFGSGLKHRHLKTTIEMSKGQAFAVAGLIKNNFVKQLSRPSFLAGIPILDRLVENDPEMIPQELLLLVTPEILKVSNNKQ